MIKNGPANAEPSPSPTPTSNQNTNEQKVDDTADVAGMYLVIAAPVSGLLNGGTVIRYGFTFVTKDGKKVAGVVQNPSASYRDPRNDMKITVLANCSASLQDDSRHFYCDVDAGLISKEVVFDTSEAKLSSGLTIPSLRTGVVVTAVAVPLCSIGQYLSNGTCVPCTNKPADHANYTTVGDGVNNCQWSCDNGYTKNGAVCQINNNPSTGCPSGGYSRDGVCWYLGDLVGRTCDDVCQAVDGGGWKCDWYSLTPDFNSLSLCTEVAGHLLGSSPAQPAGSPPPAANLGCYYQETGDPGTHLDQSANCSGSRSDVRRFCPCAP